MVQAISSSLQLRYHLPQSSNTEVTGHYFKPIPIKCSIRSNVKYDYNISKGSYYYDPNYRPQVGGSIRHKTHRVRIQSVLRPIVTNPAQNDVKLNNIRSNTRRRRSQKRVHFSETNDVRILPEKTSEDKYRSWYSKNDYTRFECERKRTVHQIQRMYQSHQYHLDPNEYTIVGVEHYIYGKEQMILRKLHSLRHTRSVLQQQQYNKSHQQFNYLPCTTYNSMDCMNMSICNNYQNTFDESLRYVSQLYSTHSMMRVNACNELLQPLHVL
jgi:hypothetical protein